MVERYQSKLSGIYAIHNSVNGKCYVGSAVNLDRRWTLHRHHLNTGRHHSSKLQRAWRKHGADAFSFEVLERCDVPKLAEREQFSMDNLNAVSSGYNVQPRARTCLGQRRSAAFKRKMSDIAKKIAASPEERMRRAERARRQHEEGRLGRQTWKPTSEASFAIKASRSMSNFWADPTNKAWMRRALVGRSYVKASSAAEASS